MRIKAPFHPKICSNKEAVDRNKIGSEPNIVVFLWVVVGGDWIDSNNYAEIIIVLQLQWLFFYGSALVPVNMEIVVEFARIIPK